MKLFVTTLGLHFPTLPYIDMRGITYLVSNGS